MIFTGLFCGMRNELFAANVHTVLPPHQQFTEKMMSGKNNDVCQSVHDITGSQGSHRAFFN
jgi:hypothetical protein